MAHTAYVMLVGQETPVYYPNATITENLGSRLVRVFGANQVDVYNLDHIVGWGRAEVSND